MDALIDALTRLIEAPDAFKGQRPPSPRAIEVALADAPASVTRLAEAMAARYYHVNLGGFSMFDNTHTSTVGSLADTLEMSADNGELDLATALPAGFDPARTLQLGADGGGMSYFGISWTDGATSFVVVEFEDPTEDNLIQTFATPADWLAFLDERCDGDPPPDLQSLHAAATT